MKKVVFVLMLICSSTLFAQNSEIQKTEKKGNLLETTIFYENGNIMQHGFYTESGKLHASWESYNIDGTRKCLAYYDYGVKVGVWTYWDTDYITKVTYDKNKIVNIEKYSLDGKIKLAY